MLRRLLQNAARSMPDNSQNANEQAALELILAELRIELPKNAVNLDTYLHLLQLTKQKANPNLTRDEFLQLARVNALKLMVAFGSYDASVKYLECSSLQRPNNPELIHDACSFSLPNKSNWSLSLWRDLIVHHKPNSPSHTIMRLFALADKIEAYFEENKETLKNLIIEKVAAHTKKTISAMFDNAISKDATLFQKWRDNELTKVQREIMKEVTREFRRYLCAELGLPPGKLTRTDQAKLAERQTHLNTEDTKKRSLIEKTIREKFGKLIADLNSLNLIADPIKAKESYIELNLIAAAGTIRAIARDKPIILKGTASIKTLLDLSKNIVYKRASENPEAAKLFFEHGITENGFNRYLELKPLDDTRLIPAVHIDGSTLCDEYKDYYITRLSSSDPLAGVLGRFTGCCQRFDDIGEEYAVFGITNAHSGFYVLCKKSYSDRPDTIVAQTWAWRNHHLVFDSIESEENFEEKHHVMISDFFTFLAAELVSNHGVGRVVVGCDGKRPEDLGTFIMNFGVDLLDYTGIRDSFTQRIIADARLPIVKFYLHRHAANRPAFNYPLKDLTLSEREIAYLYELSTNSGLLEEFHSYLMTILPDSESLRSYAEGRRALMSEWLGLNHSTDHANLGSSYRYESSTIERIKALVEEGINPNIFCHKTQMPLTFSLAECNNWQAIYWLLENDADCNLDYYDNTLLLTAARSHAWNQVKLLVNAYGADIEARDSRGRTVLNIACEYREWEMAKWLIEQRANPNTQNRNGLNPLCHAIMQRRLDMVAFLIQHGANPDQRSFESGFNSLHIACYSDYQSDNSQLIDIIKLLLANGADINAMTSSNKSPLTEAARSLFNSTTPKLITLRSLVIFLIESGADFHVRFDMANSSYGTKIGEKLLKEFVYRNEWEIIQACAKREPTILFKKFDTDNDSTLLAEFVNNAGEILLSLLTTDTINTKDEAGFTALHYAARGNDIELVKKLLAQGAHIEMRDADGKTALDSATDADVRSYLKDVMAQRALPSTVNNSLFQVRIADQTQPVESADTLRKKP